MLFLIYLDLKFSLDSDIVRKFFSGSVKDNVEVKGNIFLFNIFKVSEGGEDNFELNVEMSEISIENFIESLIRFLNLFLLVLNRNILDELLLWNKQRNGGIILVVSVEKEDRIIIKMNKLKIKIESILILCIIMIQIGFFMDKEEILFEIMFIIMIKSLVMIIIIVMDYEDGYDDENESFLFSIFKLELVLSVLELFKLKYLDECEKNCFNDNVCVFI